MTAPLLMADRLTKDYGSFRALNELSLTVAPGEVVGLLGPNGSGKTTALRLILGFLKPTHGQVTLGGFDCWQQSLQTRRLVAYLPGELRLYESMTGRQIVQFLAKLRGENPTTELDQLAKKLDINPDQPLVQMSSGMKRKVALLAVLIPHVPLIILDEPTNTLDPTMRDELLEQIRLAKHSGKSVLFSSHVLQEVEAVCDRVVILRRGELVHVQSMADLREGRHVTAKLRGVKPTVDPLGQPLEVDAIVDDRLDLEYRGPLAALLSWLSDISLEDLRIEPLGLSRIYKRYHTIG